MNKAEKIVIKLKKSYVAILLGLIMLSLSSIITISQGTSLIKEYYLSSFGRKTKLTDDIYKLAPDTNIGYFERILGSPVFINEKTDEKNIKESTQKEYIFINDYFYIQAITGKNDKVIAYSITPTNKGTHPLFSFWEGNDEIKLELNKSTFKVLNDKPEEARLYCGARRGGYSEEYYFGNPGNYQTYIFSINDILGFPSLCQEEFMNGNIGIDYSKNNEVDIENEKIQKARKEDVINTITITAPFISGKDLLFELGPNLDQIRILDTFPHLKEN